MKYIRQIAHNCQLFDIGQYLVEGIFMQKNNLDLNQNKTWIDIKSNKFQNGTSFFETFSIAEQSKVNYSVSKLGYQTPN